MLSVKISCIAGNVHSLFAVRLMPICAQRAKEACKAVIKGDSERARLLGRHDIIKVLKSEFLSEDDEDAYIVEFLKSNVAGEIQSLFSATTMHGDIRMTYLSTF
jgi:hypothetical protein